MVNNDILDFLKAIDTELVKHAQPGETLDLYLIGRSALILGYGVSLMTKDVDILLDDRSKLQQMALQAFRKGTPGARRFDFYLEPVPKGLPPIPGTYRTRSIAVPGEWVVIRPKCPEIHDLAVTKLNRFHARDREDLQILCDTGELTAAGLERALASAFAWAEDGDPSQTAAYWNMRKVIDYLEGKTREL